MDIEDLYRPLLRSASMRERHTSRLERVCGKRQSQSLDRHLRNSFIAAFDEYIYYDNGFRRFKGVSSLLVQSLVKDEEKPRDFHDNVSDHLDSESGQSTMTSVDGYTDLDGSIGSDSEEKFRNMTDLNDDTVCVKKFDTSSVGTTDTKTVDNVNKHKFSRSVIRCLSLYERERKPHYCTNSLPPEQKLHPSAWSFEKRGKRSLVEGSRRKVSKKPYEKYNATCRTKVTASDQPSVTPRRVGPDVSKSRNSVEFVNNCRDTKENEQHDKTDIGDKTLADLSFGSSAKRNLTCRPSQIPRPIRTLNFSGKIANIGDEDFGTERSSPCMTLRRSLSMIDKRNWYVSRLVQSALTTPRRGDLSNRGSPTAGRLFVDSSTLQNRCINDERKLICVPEDEDGYPEPKPSTRAKADIFHSRDYLQIDQHSLNAPASLLNNFEDLIDYLIENLTDDTAKLRAIYRWIVSQQIPLNIKSGEIIRDSPLWYLFHIREKRSSYSELFAVLCRRAFIPCVIIYGVAKSVAYDVGDRVTHKRLKNSWNAVFVGGEWRFVHPYWSRQSVKGYQTGRWAVVDCEEFHDDSLSDSKQTVSKGINDFFFLTDPDKFITKCFPDDPTWQLLPRPLTKDEYEDLPFLQPAFYQLNLQVKSHTSCVIHTNIGHVEITLGLPPEMTKRYIFSYKLFVHRDWEAEGEYDEILLDRYLLHYVQEEFAIFEIRFPVNGVYKLEMHCRDQKKSTTPDWICDYRIVCHEAMQNCEPLPIVPSIGWGLGREFEKSGLEGVSHSNALINLDHEIVTFIRFALRKDRPVSVGAKLFKIDMSHEELSSHMTVEQDSEHAVVQISPPVEGEYALQIFVTEEGAERKKNVCNFLMHRTQIVEDPELADIRNELIKATENGDVNNLSLWIERFADKDMDDRGDLTRAKKKLHLSKINRDLKEAICRKDLDFLERVMSSASDTSIKRQLGHLAEEAEAVRSRLRRLKRLQHAVLELDHKTISEIRSYPKPPPVVHGVMAATFLLLGNRESELKKWSKIQALITKGGKQALKLRVAEFNINNVSIEVLTRVRSILSRYDLETVQIASIGAATFFQWAYTMAKEASDM